MGEESAVDPELLYLPVKRSEGDAEFFGGEAFVVAVAFEGGGDCLFL